MDDAEFVLEDCEVVAGFFFAGRLEVVVGRLEVVETRACDRAVDAAEPRALGPAAIPAP
ncbi:MAG TPA: hypothetical protein VE088_01450 [Gaiellaceae bacterium]|nr:hypothetical protein [Gaiellaceae bacterium]